MKRWILVLSIAVGACEPQPAATPRDCRIADASEFTERYAHSRLAAWKLRASAAGHDCDVLLIETPVIMEDSLIEAMHYGAGTYGIYGGGVQRFSSNRTFRGVVYRDAAAHTWHYGAVTEPEAVRLERCAARRW